MTNILQHQHCILLSYPQNVLLYYYDLISTKHIAVCQIFSSRTFVFGNSNGSRSRC